MGRPVLALQLTRVKMTRLLLLVCCAALSVNARKFCPKEKNGDECRAKENQYKCGVFFKDLTSKVPLAWLGALPEAVVRARKEGASDDDVISLLGSNVDAESHEGEVCGETLANTRCYAQMTKVKDEDLDSCGKSLVRKKWSEQAEETMGDYLCGQVHRWLKRNSDYKANGKDNIDGVHVLRVRKRMERDLKFNRGEAGSKGATVLHKQGQVQKV